MAIKKLFVAEGSEQVCEVSSQQVGSNTSNYSLSTSTPFPLLIPIENRGQG